MRILLVDDDTAVIQALLAILKTLPGNDVRVAMSGEKALENAAALGGVDLLITDVVMEPMDGFTLRSHILAQYPEARTILISGYDLSDYAEHTEGLQLLTKPIDADALREAIDREWATPVALEPAPEPEPAPAPAPVPVPVAVARPTVRATAVPTASAQPTVKVSAAPPTATPVAVPRPTATPVAVPPQSAAPIAPATVRVATTGRLQPVPSPSAPQAKVVPVASAAPVPVAKPAAPSTAVQTVRATAVPAAMASPKAVARPASPSAAPRANSQPQPVAPVPVAAPAAPVAVAPVTIPAPVVEPGELTGQVFGAYQLHRKIGDGRWGSIYAAVQVSINRPVAIEILDAEKAADEETRNRFIAEARAKAQVQHPSIVAVYEAGEADQRYFYAHEFVDGGSLADLKAAGERLDEVTALKVLRVAADGLSYLTGHHIPHYAPDATSILLGADGRAHLANLATPLADQQLSSEQEIQALGRIMLSSLPAIQSIAQGLRDLLKGMVQTGPEAHTTWGEVLQGIKAIEPKVVPMEAAKISAHDRAAIAAMELAKKQQKRTLYFSIGSVVSLLVIVGVIAWFVFSSNERNLDEQVDIPAGDFLFANGEKQTLPEFWIDKYEVTYGEYAKFVHALQARPTSDFDDLRQPHGMKTAAMHKPEHWDIYYPCAVAGRPVHGTPIDLNSPVMEVDVWDAYAYAKWKGRELPTEQEWEKAGRGTQGFKYPWGEDPDPKKVNSGADFDMAHPDAKGKVDGWNYWNPVDKIKGDKSPFGVIGMAGNVREWTGTWDTAKRRPVVKGGSFMSSEVNLDQRNVIDPNTISEAIGFRTVSHSPPVKK